MDNVSESIRFYAQTYLRQNPGTSELEAREWAARRTAQSEVGRAADMVYLKYAEIKKGFVNSGDAQSAAKLQALTEAREFEAKVAIMKAGHAIYNDTAAPPARRVLAMGEANKALYAITGKYGLQGSDIISSDNGRVYVKDFTLNRQVSVRDPYNGDQHIVDLVLNSTRGASWTYGFIGGNGVSLFA